MAAPQVVQPSTGEGKRLRAALVAPAPAADSHPHRICFPDCPAPQEGPIGWIEVELPNHGKDKGSEVGNSRWRMLTVCGRPTGSKVQGPIVCCRRSCCGMAAATHECTIPMMHMSDPPALSHSATGCRKLGGGGVRGRALAGH